MQLNRILAIALIVVCFFAAITASRQSSITPSSSESIAPPSLSGESFWPRGDRIVAISLQGPISADASGLMGSRKVAARLRQLAKEDRVKGVLLKLNSPGGTVGASQELYRAVKKVRENKPIVVAVGDLAASGAYYTASAADEIVAYPGSLVGSIGVIIQGINAAELLEKIGISPETIKTGQFKDLLSPTRALSEPERELLADLIDNAYQQFIEDVARGRQHLPENAEAVLSEEVMQAREGMTVEQVRQLADGRIFTGQQALAAGLVDELGGIDEAIANLRTWIGNDDIPVSTEFPDLNLFWNLFQSQFSGFSPSPGNALLSPSPAMQTTSNLSDAPVLWLSPWMQLQAQLVP
ncbi:signal peptide peptidase SppA [Synechococcus sp. PCC 7336]|uniref:signal peptide peptidase SppA n=1 Tax=Synechococcus sp. PCC 7336 TaxID=195250 RepID=UPI00034BDFAD|nr:signal peptide peptidase SppA [Synechococcus sp. PCC 7336]